MDPVDKVYTRSVEYVVVNIVVTQLLRSVNGRLHFYASSETGTYCNQASPCIAGACFFQIQSGWGYPIR